MTRGAKLWVGAAVVFTIINAGGAWMAMAEDEPGHAIGHVVALVVGAAAYIIWQVVARGRQRNLPDARQADARIEYLQQSVDAIALEVERIGEAQRFSDRLRVERGETSPSKREE